MVANLLKARWFDMTTGDFFDQVEKANPQKVVAYFEDEKWTAAQVNIVPKMCIFMFSYAFFGNF